MQSRPVLTIRALGKRHRAGIAGCWADARALVNVHVEIRKGEIAALIGARGAGKTTLLRCAAKLLVPDEGFVDLAPHEDGSEGVVQYFADCVQAGRAAARGDRWDVALVDDVDEARGDVAAAFALVRIVARAKRDGTSLVLAARDACIVGELADCTLTLEHGRLVDQRSAARPLVARVAEHVAPLTVIPGASSIR